MSAMTKKLFEEVAKLISDQDLTDEQTEEIARAFCDLFERHNHRFDRSRFMEACRGPWRSPAVSFDR